MTDQQIRKAIYVVHQRIWNGVIEKLQEARGYSILTIKRLVWDRIKDDYSFCPAHICIGCEFSTTCSDCSLRSLKCARIGSNYSQLQLKSTNGINKNRAIHHAKIIRDCGYYQNRGDICQMKGFLKL